MQNKQIIFTAPGVAELLDNEIKAPGAGEVLVETVYSTISAGTERANLAGDPNVSTSRRSVGRPVTFPRTLGYCSSAIVREVGEGVTKVKPGDRVAVSWGKHSRYQVRGEVDIHPLPEGITMRDAALGLIATFPMAAIRKCRLEMGESAIVMGQGILGQLAVQLLRAAGAVPVIAADPVEAKREMALALGADYALDPFADDFADRVRAITGGGVKVAIEVTGNGKALDQVLDCMARFGRVALLGCTRDSNFTIDYYRKVHGPGITMVGAHTMARPSHESSPGWWTTADDMQAVFALAAGGRIRLESMVEETHSPAEATEIYARLMREKAFPVVQFDWGLIK
ncbi:MAG: zinc-binding alcohol dehydrogenase [Clostridia bacterium]|nr:zinc-binding alcohol dehydrogenase [Clostridia bacterium]